MAEPVFGLAQFKAIRHVSFCKEKLIGRLSTISPGDRYLHSRMAEPLNGFAAAKIGFLIRARIPIGSFCYLERCRKRKKADSKTGLRIQQLL